MPALNRQEPCTSKHLYRKVLGFQHPVLQGLLAQEPCCIVRPLGLRDVSKGQKNAANNYTHHWLPSINSLQVPTSSAAQHCHADRFASLIIEFAAVDGLAWQIGGGILIPEGLCTPISCTSALKCSVSGYFGA